jgi:hypothetical protein
MFRALRLTRHLHQPVNIVTPTIGATRVRPPSPTHPNNTDFKRKMSGELKAEATGSVPTASAERTAIVNAWKDLRFKRLHHDDGWLTLCGLDWLEVGENKVGSNESCGVRLPACCPANAATLVLNADETIRLIPAAGVTCTAGDVTVPASGVEIKSDAKGAATVVTVPNTLGGAPQVSFFVIKRDTKIGVRMKDKKNPVYTQFTGLEYFPVSDEWAIPAVYKPHPGGEKILPTVNMYGLSDPQRSPGLLEFSVAGKTFTLDVVDEDGEPDRFFILFKDLTSGKETYGMRYMYCPRPAAGTNTTVIDFNQSYSPPCCFTPYATCAIPPKQNHLPFRVSAGEKMYGKPH